MTVLATRNVKHLAIMACCLIFAGCAAQPQRYRPKKHRKKGCDCPKWTAAPPAAQPTNFVLNPSLQADLAADPDGHHH